MIPEALSKPSLDLIPRDGLADLSGNDEGHFCLSRRLAQKPKDQEPSGRRVTPGQDQTDPLGFGSLLCRLRRPTLNFVIVSVISAYVLFGAVS